MPDEAHFTGCHPDDTEAPRDSTPDPQQVEECWHCHTPTTRGICGCAECWESVDDVPPEAVYHCATCGRWWAYMYPRITSITFNAPPQPDSTFEDRGDGED